MSSLAVVAGMVAVFVALASREYRNHQRRIRAIPHRIHVNGSRGKSSVTRLIGAGLRAGGVPTITKVTGTFPRLILADGSDVPVHRKAAANILEQLNIVDFALDQKAQALVIECMAVDPEFQRITEEQMIHATLSVITNVRLDHTEEMGRTLGQIARSMANTMGKEGKVMVADPPSSALWRNLARERGNELMEVDIQAVSDADLAGFSYIEHRENVALSLAVCAELGVARDVALRGMWDAAPDAGVLTRSRVQEDGAALTFFNAFAANDPDSTLMIWNKLRDEGHLADQRFVLLNSRADRKERSEHLAHLVAERLEPRPDAVFVMGEPTDAVVRWLRSHGLERERIVDVGGTSPQDIVVALLQRTRGESSVVAVGNMGGRGAATAAYCEQRSRASHG